MTTAHSSKHSLHVLIVVSLLGGFSASPLRAHAQAEHEARAVIGFEQAGASATKAEQHFFFDFFIDRQMKTESLSLWGHVRIASYPQQINTPVAQFAANFANNVGNIQVNQLAESGEFLTGLDWHPKKLRWDVGKDKRRLGFVFSVGAKGPFEPKSRLSLFTVPDPTSPQYPSFAAQFPSAAHSTYVGFIPPDRDRFYRSYGAGIRITTLYDNPSDSSFRSPATYSLTFGQDENVSGGTLTGAVAKIDVFYPLPLTSNNFRFLYLFGNADLRLSRARNITPFVLAPAPSNITGAESSVAIISTPSNRDVYRIGVGVDAISLIGMWLNK